MRETVVVAFSTQEENVVPVTRALKKLAAQAKAMPGCISYVATTVADDPTMFNVRYKWETDADRRSYMNSDAMLAFLDSVVGMLNDLTVAKQAPLQTPRESCL